MEKLLHKHIYLVISEYDVDFERYPARVSRDGPFISETYLERTTKDQALEHCKRLGNRYGESRVLKLTVTGEYFNAEKKP